MVDPAWVALSLRKQIGGKTFRALLAHFDDDLHAIINADIDTLREVDGIGAKIATSIKTIDLVKAESIIQAWQNQGIHILTWNDPKYPSRLHDLSDAPPTIFVQGDLECINQPKTVAIVGTRQPSPQAKQLARQLCERFVAQKYILISGLAYGIDFIAHEEVMAVSGAKTIAVLGSGLLNIYPPKHQKHATSIAQFGTLLCEVAPSASVSPAGLVSRNRLITGLSEAVIIVESDVNGGAMHAGRFAKLQGRKIYTFDLPASGNQALLNDGAICIPLDLQDFPDSDFG